MAHSGILHDIDVDWAKQRLTTLLNLSMSLKYGYLCGRDRLNKSGIGPGYVTFRRRLSRELAFQQGKVDRLTGLPARSAHGMYLNGWYFDQFLTSIHDLYCITMDELNAAQEYVRSIEKEVK